MIHIERDDKFNLRYLGVSSEEVRNNVGVFQSDDDEVVIMKIIASRAKNICALHEGVPLDFTASDSSNPQRLVTIANNRRRLTRDDSQISGGMVVLNLGTAIVTAGIGFLANASWRAIATAVAIDVGLSYSADLVFRQFNDVDVKGFLSYYYLYFTARNQVVSATLLKVF